MTQLTHDVIPAENGGFRYRILDGDTVLLTSGPCLLREDADRLGAHFAADALGTLDFINRKSK